ncbi:MAG: DUF4838 domain-containing protein [Kiritimatiellia bacterium]
MILKKWFLRILAVTFLASGIVLPTLSATASDGVCLVKDGKPAADIVLETNALASVQLAAKDLQEHVEKMSGARMEIGAAPADKFKCHVYVGPSEFTRKLGISDDDLKPEGFKIIAKDNFVVLIGHDLKREPLPFSSKGEGLKKWQEFAGEKYTYPMGDLGPYNKDLGIYADEATATLYAASELLEQLGVRWYNPYENGTIIPEKKTITVPEQALKKEPKFPYRFSTFYGAMRSDAEGVMWFKRLKYGTSYGILIGHTTGDILGWGSEEQKKAHPEYFAVVDGKMVTVPRLCDENFRKSSINFLDKMIEAHPWLKFVNVQMTDGLSRIDDRDALVWSRQGRGYLGKYSDYIWDYWLYVAAELKKNHPGVYLRCNSYAPYAEPPSQIKELPDNVVICIAQSTGSSFLPQDPANKLRAMWLPILTSKKLFLWDYYLFYRTGESPRYPVFFTKHLQEDMQKLNGVCEGKIIEIAAAPDKNKKWGLACPGLTHMLHYWQGKLYWDPDLDRLKMLDEYYELYFGPARKEMKEFYEFAEEVWMRPESRSITIAGGFLREKDVDRYFEILKRAREKAGAGSVYDQRIAQIEEEMQPLKKMFPMVRVGPDFTCLVTDQPVIVDGDLQKKFWQGDIAWYPMEEWKKKAPVPPELASGVAFRLTPDRSNLVIGVKCSEPEMDKIPARAKEHDDFDIFNDDRIEVRIETPERSYFKLAVNTEGLIWDETQDVTLVTKYTLPVLWNPGTKAAIKKEKDCWTAEIMIPTEDFGSKGPDRANPWGINVYRIRRVGGVREVYDIAPTAEKLPNDLVKMGNMIVTAP